MKKIIIGLYIVLNVCLMQMPTLANANEQSKILEASRNDVLYVSDRTGKAGNNGTITSPLKLDAALREISDNGTIKILDSVLFVGYGEKNDTTAPFNTLPEKNITFEGVGDKASFIYHYSLVLNGNITFRNLDIQSITLDIRDIYCNGYNLIFDNVTANVPDILVPTIYAGAIEPKTTNPDNQLIKLNSGKFNAIVAGGRGINKGKVNIELSGKVRQNISNKELQGIQMDGAKAGSFTGQANIHITGNAASAIKTINGGTAATTLTIRDAVILNSYSRFQNIDHLRLYNTVFETKNIEGLQDVFVGGDASWSILEAQTVEHDVTGNGKLIFTGAKDNQLHIKGEIQDDMQLDFSSSPAELKYLMASSSSTGSLTYHHKSNEPPYHIGKTLIVDEADGVKSWSIKSYDREVTEIKLGSSNILDNTIILDGGKITSRKDIIVESYDQHQNQFYNIMIQLGLNNLKIVEPQYQQVISEFEPFSTYVIPVSNTLIPAGDMHVEVSVNQNSKNYTADMLIHFKVRPILTLTSDRTVESDSDVRYQLFMEGADAFDGTLQLVDVKNNEIIDEREVDGANSYILEIPESSVSGKSVRCNYIPANSDLYVAASSNEIIPEVLADSIEVKEDEKILEVSQTYQINTQILPETTTNKTLTYQSSDQTVAQVDHTGMVTANKEGSADIIIQTQNGKQASVHIIVSDRPISVTINPTRATIRVGAEFNAKAYIKPQLTDEKITYYATTPSVADVDAQGKVVARFPGYTYIIARTSNGLEAKCLVQVVGIEAQSITMNIDRATLSIGRTFKAVAKIYPNNTTNKKITFTSSDPKVATVDTAGNVTAIGPGTADIYATAMNQVRGCVTVQVLPDPKAVSIRPDRATVKVGASFKATSTVTPVSAVKNVSYSSSTPAVASIDKDGNVKALHPGYTYITVKTHNGKTAKFLLRVV